MSGVKIDVSWSPNHDDKFIVCGTDLKLYKVEKEPPPPKFQGIYGICIAKFCLYIVRKQIRYLFNQVYIKFHHGIISFT